MEVHLEPAGVVAELGNDGKRAALGPGLFGVIRSQAEATQPVRQARFRRCGEKECGERSRYRRRRLSKWA